MEKIKKVWKENRVLMVLAIILIVCVVVFAVVAIPYFYGSSDDVYGTRLDVTKKVVLNKKLLEDVKDELEKSEFVENAVVTLKGKIVYINIKFTDGLDMTEAKKIAEEVVALFNEDELEVYDLQFTIKSEKREEVDSYTLMGARNHSGNGTVVWNNYNVEIDAEEGSAEE